MSYAATTEPTNDNHWAGSNVGTMAVFTALGGYGHWSSGSDVEINPSGDADWFLVTTDPATCGMTGYFARVEITSTPASGSGDLDLQVYHLNGNLLGGSYSSGVNETVDVAAQKATTLVVKVYGYLTATNKYALGVECD